MLTNQIALLENNYFSHTPAPLPLGEGKGNFRHKFT